MAAISTRVTLIMLYCVRSGRPTTSAPRVFSRARCKSADQPMRGSGRLGGPRLDKLFVGESRGHVFCRDGARLGFPSHNAHGIWRSGSTRLVSQDRVSSRRLLSSLVFSRSKIDVLVKNERSRERALYRYAAPKGNGSFLSAG